MLGSGWSGFNAWLGLERLRPCRAGLDQARPDLAGWIGLNQAHLDWIDLARVELACGLSPGQILLDRLGSAQVGSDWTERRRIGLGQVGPASS